MRRYRLILGLVLPVLLLRLVWRVLRGHEPAASLTERLGGGMPTRAGAVWLHAASNGELVSARPLIEAMFADNAEMRLLLTVNTITARQMAQEWANGWAKGRIEARMAPLDARLCLSRFLARHRPCALIVIENEIWPNRFIMAQERAMPVLIAGGRMSARSARRWRKLGLGPMIAPAITAVSAQDSASETGFRDFGVSPERILPIVNLKTAVALPEATWSPGWARDKTVLAASTHEGEEEIVLEAFCRARQASPDLHLILAPRHPRRAADISRLIAASGLTFQRRSEGVTPTEPGHIVPEAVLLADTMGEMANWYRAASLCFVGGTLVAKGGHTPFEPVACGCAIIHGPSIDNHRAAFDALDHAGAAFQVRNSETLTQAFLQPEAEIAQMAEAARLALSPLMGSAAVEALSRTLLARISAQTGIK